MKRFKLIFHICYVIIALTVLYFSIDVLINTEAYLSKVKLSSYIKFPRYVMIAFLSLAILMIVEFILERFHVYQIKDGIDEMENEIVRLKAKLYDKAEEEDEDEDDGEDDDDDDSDDDDDDD